MNICLLWAVFGHRGYMWHYSKPRRVRGGTIGSMPTNFGNLPKVRERQEASCRWTSQYWQVASVAGKVPKLVKVPEPKHCTIARCEVCVSIYITYILVSKSTPLAVTGPHGQLASYIFPSFPSVRLCVRHRLSCRSRWTYRHDFWHDDGSWVWHADFCKIWVIGQRSRSKIHENMPFLGLFWSQGHVWYYSGPGRVKWGTIGSMPTNFGNLPKVRERQEVSSRQVSRCWQVASVAGKVPNLKKVPGREVCASYIANISVSKSSPLAVTGPHGQLASVLLLLAACVSLTEKLQDHWFLHRQCLHRWFILYHEA